MAKQEKTVAAARDRTDGRRQILLYLKAEMITALKIEAMERGVNAYELAEEAIEAFLAKRKRKKP